MVLKTSVPITPTAAAIDRLTREVTSPSVTVLTPAPLSRQVIAMRGLVSRFAIVPLIIRKKPYRLRNNTDKLLYVIDIGIGSILDELGLQLQVRA